MKQQFPEALAAQDIGQNALLQLRRELVIAFLGNMFGVCPDRAVAIYGPFGKAIVAMTSVAAECLVHPDRAADNMTEASKIVICASAQPFAA